MILAKMAFRNLSRHRLRTFVSILAIAFSVLIVVFARGYVTGMADATSLTTFTMTQDISRYPMRSILPRGVYYP